MFPFATHLTDGGSGIVPQRIWSCNKLVSQAWSTKAFTSAAKNGIKGRTWTSNMLGWMPSSWTAVWTTLLLVFGSSLSAATWYYTFLDMPSTFLVQALKTCQPFPARLKGWTGWSASNLSVLPSTRHTETRHCFSCIIVWRGGVSEDKWPNKVWCCYDFPHISQLPFVYLVISRNLWVYQGPMTCHI